MTYEEFDKCVVVEPTRYYASGLYMEDRFGVAMNAYVIEWRIDEGYKTLKGISGVFLSREDAASALEGTRMPCYKRIPNGIWKLGTSECAAIVGEARPMTKDGETWEIYGPDGGLVDGNGMDEPEFHIREYEIGKMEGGIVQIRR